MYYVKYNNYYCKVYTYSYMVLRRFTKYYNSICEIIITHRIRHGIISTNVEHMMNIGEYDTLSYRFLVIDDIDASFAILCGLELEHCHDKQSEDISFDNFLFESNLCIL